MLYKNPVRSVTYSGILGGFLKDVEVEMTLKKHYKQILLFLLLFLIICTSSVSISHLILYARVLLAD